MNNFDNVPRDLLVQQARKDHGVNQGVWVSKEREDLWERSAGKEERERRDPWELVDLLDQLDFKDYQDHRALRATLVTLDQKVCK